MMKRRDFLKVITLGGLFSIPFFDVAEARRYIPYIKRLRHSSSSKRVRIVLDLSGKVDKKRISDYIKHNYLVFIVKGLRTNRKKYRIYSEFAKYVELIPLTRSKTKIRIKLDAPHRYKIFALKARHHKPFRPFRLVIDIFPDFVSSNCKPRFGKRIVVIDPGHGGKDPGAVWPIHWRHPKYKEKYITLAIARKVKRILETDPSITVIMTRNRDVFVPLLRRAEIAAKACADAFVSIHADSIPSHPNCSGVTVFKASPTLFAKAEDTAEEIAKNVKLCSDTMCWSITPVIVSLSSTVTFVESGRLAESIVKRLKANTNENIVKGIKDMKRNILVLKTPGRPAVLIETGFMTNRKDRHRLVQSKYQWEIARGIAEGIKDYLHSLDKVAMY
ncbi:N-acetylmuramoyl-L-alanine amidase [Desulfurobacterium sp.]|uniref:N-acetylmuramoyl-L-alanine amidase family protein n=1 Tax=Desulfurobacterium sp. TaxID=2004706 RepID=UPI002601E9A6|nr:N-acetylmuramoyl-L-alanine amidase [Desulfurobacterium sp.]